MNQILKELCANWWTDRLKVVEKRELFKQALLPLIHNDMILKISYDPCDILLQAIRESGIECWGTMFSARGIFDSGLLMKIREQRISVKENGWSILWEGIDGTICRE